jgi:hypothetical protein
MRTALDAPPGKLDEHERNVVANIREHGWFDHQVAAEPGYKGFHYTTGFWKTANSPELIVFSLKIAHDILWNLYKRARAGEDLPVGQPVPDVLGGVDVMFLPVDKKHYREHLGWNRWFYGGDDFPCLQLVYPDLENVFPWQPGFDPAWGDRQDDLTAGDWGRASR